MTPAEKNYKIILSYDGTRYYGFEHQPDKDTIQGRLENVLGRMTGQETVEVIGAGRTDAGVHAKGMVVSVRLALPMTPEEIRDTMNRYLPDDISCEEVREAGDRFHARYNATGKTYRYSCYIGKTKEVFRRKYCLPLDFRPDITAMQEAAQILTGKHDFKSFCGNPRMKKSTIRVVDEIRIEEKKSYLYFTIHGTGFLQHMVRIMVGTLLLVGEGRLSPEEVEQILLAEDRSKAGPTAPAKGLCLEKVDYD